MPVALFAASCTHLQIGVIVLVSQLFSAVVFHVCCVCRGSCAGRDINLENFSVSNGGKDLIADASVIMAYGRRYGLIGRNGTGVCACVSTSVIAMPWCGVCNGVNKAACECAMGSR